MDAYRDPFINEYNERPRGVAPPASKVSSMSQLRRLFAVPALAVAPLALAGSVLELEMKEYDQDPPVVSTIEISTEGRSSRMEVTTVGQGESAGMIYRGDSAGMVAIDHGKREYYVLDEATVERMAVQLGNAMKEMEKALESMPPDQRAMAEQMMKQHLPESMQQPPGPPATLHATGEEGSFGGYDCEYYDVRRADVKIRELCVTPWGELPDGRSMAGAMLEMADFLDRITTAVSEGAGMDVMGGQQEILAHMQELDGYPVLTRELDESGDVASETVLTSAATEDFEAAEFQPPAGYTEMNLGL